MLFILVGLALLQPDTALEQQVEALIKAVNTADNRELKFTGEGFQKLPPKALPLLKKALNRNDLNWVARASIAKGIRIIERNARPSKRDPADEAYTAEFKRIYLGEYKRVSRRDKKWDKAAHAALLNAADDFGDNPRRARDAWEQAWKNMELAHRQGCDDPLLQFLRSKTWFDQDIGTAAERIARYDRVAAELAKSGYHPILKLWSYLNAGDVALEHAGGKKSGADAAARYLKAVEPLVEAAKSDKKLRTMTLVDEAVGLIDRLGRAKARKEGFDTLHKGLVEALPGSPIPDIVEGYFFTEYAWDARGSGYAETVTPEGWRLFKDRLVRAKRSLEKAWKKGGPHAGVPARYMLKVIKGLGAGYGELETWFARAIEGNPDSWQSCEEVRVFLEPKWYGTIQKMRKFGRRLLLMGNWEGGIPTTLVSVHLRAASYEGGLRPKDQIDFRYFDQDDVWKECCVVFDESLRRYPDRWELRVQYAWLACRTNRWETARRQFEFLGRFQYATGMYGSEQAYENDRAEANRRAGKR